MSENKPFKTISESELDNINGGAISQDDNGQWWVFADDYSTGFPAESRWDAMEKAAAHGWWITEVRWPFSAAKKDKGAISPNTSPAREG